MRIQSIQQQQTQQRPGFGHRAPFAGPQKLLEQVYAEVYKVDKTAVCGVTPNKKSAFIATREDVDRFFGEVMTRMGLKKGELPKAEGKEFPIALEISDAEYSAFKGHANPLDAKGVLKSKGFDPELLRLNT